LYIAHLSTAITLNQTVLNSMVFQKMNGHRVVALCPEDEWTEAIKARGIEVIEVPFIRHSLLHSFTTAALRTFLVCRKEKFDVVHTHTLLPGIAGRVAARLARIPAVVHTFHSWPLHNKRGKAFSIVYQALELLAAYFAHVILFQNSDDMRSWSQIPGMPKEKATLIGNGIDCQTVMSKVQPIARETVHKEFGIEDHVTLIIMVARLELYKGHKMVLKAIKQIMTDTDHKVAALFVGIGKDRSLIEEESNHLGLQDVVKFTGYRLDVPDLISASDISVLTSLYEGIPRALMESMVLGVPVIATDVPGSRTLIRSGENGILVNHDDVPELTAAIRNMIEDPDLANRLANAGRQMVLSEYDEHSVVTRVEEIYKKLLENDAARQPKFNPLASMFGNKQGKLMLQEKRAQSVLIPTTGQGIEQGDGQQSTDWKEMQEMESKQLTKLPQGTNDIRKGIKDENQREAAK
jgi:glycosyltransferase involved in cell wall biosynthesis